MYKIGKKLALEKEQENKVISLRQCQKECLEKIYSTNFYNHTNYGYQLACGSGKSIIIKEIIKHYSDYKILVLVPTLLLLEQFKKLLSDVKSVGYRGTNDKDNIYKNRVVVSVYNSVVDINTKIFDFCIIDEAHNIFKLQKAMDFGYVSYENSETYVDLIRKIRCTRLLFSATLDEQHNIQYKYSMSQSVKDKCIVDYNLHILTGFTKLEQLSRLSGNKMLIYCKDIQTCQQVSEELNCKYLSGEMPQKERAEILEDFRLNQRYLVSCRTLSEGIDLKYADSCLFYNERHNQIDVIQCIGRVMRCTQAKQIADVYVLSDDVESSIQKYCQLLYDYSENLVDKISVIRHKTSEESDEEDDDFEFEDVSEDYQEVIVKNCSQQVQEPIEFWKELFKEFIEEFGRLPKQGVNEKFKGYNIGHKLNSIKQQKYQPTKELYQWLMITYPQFFIQVDQLQIWKNLYTEFIEEFSRLPKRTEQYKGYKIGSKLNNIMNKKQHIGCPQNRELYKWITTTYPYLFEKIDRVEQTKQLFIDFINQYNRLPKQREYFQNHNIGQIYNHIQRQTSNNDKILYQWITTTYPQFFQYTRQELWKQLFIDFINQYNRLPIQSGGEMFQGYNIGTKLNRIKHKTNATQSEKELYQFLTTTYPQFFGKIDRVEQTKQLFIEFINEFNRFPKQTEQYKGINIGKKLSDIKKQKHQPTKELYKWLTQTYPQFFIEYRQSIQQWKLLFTEFINKFDRLPTCREQYQGYNIGPKLCRIRRQNTDETKQLYNWLTTTYPHLFEESESE